jgi:taurine dioxygenase
MTIATESDGGAAPFGLDIKPIGGAFGAELRGLRLGGDLQPATINAIKQAVLKYRAVFFRGQNLDDAGQEAFARLWGKKLLPHPTIPSLEGTEAILDVDGGAGRRASQWHADITFIDAYPSISILRAVVLPERGGDTLWADTRSAYAGLPVPLQELADKLWALHTNDYDYAGTRKVRPEGLQHFTEVFTAQVFETEHPLVRIHPATGEKVLILGNFIRKLIGYRTFDSQHLLEIFHEHLTRPENTLRWRWSPGDVAVWDNYATAHRAVDDYGDLPRIAHRTTLEGEVPVSVDGRRSVTRPVSNKQAIAA